MTAVSGASSYMKPASAECLQKVFLCRSTYLISYKSLEILTSSSHTGLVHILKISSTRAKGEILTVSLQTCPSVVPIKVNCHTFSFLQLMLQITVSGLIYNNGHNLPGGVETEKRHLSYWSLLMTLIYWMQI